MANYIELSVIVSVFNEEDVIETFWQELRKELVKINSWDNCEIIFVNDGSIDKSEDIIKAFKSDGKVRLINLSRNYGHEAAMISGIDHAKGKFIVCLDADLQHPPDRIGQMLKRAKSGSNIVLMRRLVRKDGGFLKNLMSNAFYYFINKISPLRFEKNASDFFLIDNNVASVLKKDFRERIRFLRGYIQLVGFDKSVIEYTAPPRAGGRSKYQFNQLISLSLETVVSFSKTPLKLGLALGAFFGMFSIIIVVYSLWKFIVEEPPSGYTTLITTISFFFSLQFFLMGIIGTYIGFLFDEIKKRPVYLVRDIYEDRE